MTPPPTTPPPTTPTTAPTTPSARWRRVQELFEAAADLPPAEQATHLERACGGDEGLRCEVAALLRSDAAAGTFIESAIRRGSDLLLAAQPDPLATLGRAGKVELLERIGEGGFGVVYKGRDPVLQRYVAVKTCSSRDEKLRRRFVREGQIAAGLQHPNITTVHDLGVERGVPYLVQEFLEGEDLNHKIARREPLSPLQRLDILVQVARGLDYAHRQGVLHRDIKPANVRVLPDGAVKIMDFGIAKLLHEVSDVTTQGLTLGTVGYLAPEQLRGEAVDQRTDIFSFGVVAYELLTLERPFKGSTFSEVSYRLLNEEPHDVRELAPAWSRAVADLVGRCLAKDPRQRCASCGEILAVLEPEIEALRSGAFAVAAPAISPAAPAAPARAAGRFPRWGSRLPAGAARRVNGVPRRAPTAWWLLAAVALAVMVGLGGRTLRVDRQGAVAPAASRSRLAAASAGSPAAAAAAAAGAPGAAAGEKAAPGAAGAAGGGSAPGPGAAGRGAASEPVPTAANAASAVSAGSAASGSESPVGGGAAGPGGAGAGAAAPGGARTAPDRARPGPPAARARGAATLADRPGVKAAGRGSPTAGAAPHDLASGRPADPAAGSLAERRGDAGGHAAAEGVQGIDRPAPAVAPPAPGQAPPAALAAASPVAAEGGGGAPPPGSGGSDGGAVDNPDAVAGGAPAAPGAPRPMVRGDLILPGSSGVVPPRLISRPEPAYPDRARRRRAEADVMLLVLVDETGHVVRAIVKRTDDTKLGFNEAASRAALHATFTPATRDGIPGKMWTELPFSFRFND
jgi:serine/threonine-protein kinase